MYTQPDYCPGCHNGEWEDRDNCDYCDGAGYVCPIDQGILAVYQSGWFEIYQCLACNWQSNPE